MESGKDLLAINRQAFNWASHLKLRIFQDDYDVESKRRRDNTDSEQKVTDQQVVQGS